MKETKLIIFLCLLVAGLTYFLVSSVSNNAGLEKIYRQNQLARDSLMKKIQLDSATYYHKYATIQSNLIEKEKELKGRDEKILTLSVKEILLKKLIDSLSGRIVKMGKGTSGIPYGSILSFTKRTEFYTADDSVFVEKVPWMKRAMEFVKFKLKHILARDKEGRWSGYSKFEPNFINNYIDIIDEEVFVDRDEYLRIENDIDKFRLTLIPTFGLLQKDNSLFGAGLKALINKKHLIEVTKGIANDWLWFGYGYSFDVVK